MWGVVNESEGMWGVENENDGWGSGNGWWRQQ